MLSNHYKLLQSSIPVFLCYIVSSDFSSIFANHMGQYRREKNVFMLFQEQIQRRLGWPQNRSWRKKVNLTRTKKLISLHGFCQYPKMIKIAIYSN